MSDDSPGTDAVSADLVERSTSFGRVAEQYDSFRPAPPIEVVRWLFPTDVDTVVDLGAGTGAMFRLLSGVANHVIAVEPDPDMRRRLVASLPGVDVRDGRGEALPVPDGSADGVVASSSWHWVEPVAGLRETARALRGRGVMAAIWSGPDPDGVFVGQAQAALANGAEDRVLSSTLSGDFAPPNLTLEIPAGLPFEAPAYERFNWELALNADQLIGLLGTLSWIIVMGEEDRRRVFDRARRVLSELGIEGAVTVDVDFVCDAYRSRRSS